MDSAGGRGNNEGAGSGQGQSSAPSGFPGFSQQCSFLGNFLGQCCHFQKETVEAELREPGGAGTTTEGTDAYFHPHPNSADAGRPQTGSNGPGSGFGPHLNNSMPLGGGGGTAACAGGVGLGLAGAGPGGPATQGGPFGPSLGAGVGPLTAPTTTTTPATTTTTTTMSASAPGGGPPQHHRGTETGGATQPEQIAPGEVRAFKIDNSVLNITGPPGIAYRYSKAKADKVRREASVSVAKWNEIIEGIDEGDGWLKVATVDGTYYLPMKHEGIPVVTPVTRSEAAAAKAKAAAKAHSAPHAPPVTSPAPSVCVNPPGMVGSGTSPKSGPPSASTPSPAPPAAAVAATAATAAAAEEPKALPHVSEASEDMESEAVTTSTTLESRPDREADSKTVAAWEEKVREIFFTEDRRADELIPKDGMPATVLRDKVVLLAFPKSNMPDDVEASSMKLPVRRRLQLWNPATEAIESTLYGFDGETFKYPALDFAGVTSCTQQVGRRLTFEEPASRFTSGTAVETLSEVILEAWNRLSGKDVPANISQHLTKWLKSARQEFCCDISLRLYRLKLEPRVIVTPADVIKATGKYYVRCLTGPSFARESLGKDLLCAVGQKVVVPTATAFQVQSECRSYLPLEANAPPQKEPAPPPANLKTHPPSPQKAKEPAAKMPEPKSLQVVSETQLELPQPTKVMDAPQQLPTAEKEIAPPTKVQEHACGWQHKPSVGTWLLPKPIAVQAQSSADVAVAAKPEPSAPSPQLAPRFEHRPSVGTWLLPLPKGIASPKSFR